MSQPAFKPANKLEEVLVAASTDPGARPEFYRLLVESELFLITPAAPAQPGKRVLQPNERVSFVHLQSAQGSFLPVFTSQQRLQAIANTLGQKYGYVAVRGKDLFPLLAQLPPAAVLNPGAAYGKALTPDEIRRLADGSILRTEGQMVEKAKEVMVGQPANYPTELADALSRLFEKNSSVQAAYLAQMQDPDMGDKSHLIIGIEADGDFQKTAGEALLTAQGVLGNEEFADVVQIGGGQRTLDSYFKEQTKPFYQAGARKQ